MKSLIIRVIISVVLEGRDYLMATVVVRNGNVDGALRTLKQRNAKDGLQKQVRDRLDGYMKPGVKRRKAKKEAIRNSRKRARKENRYN